MTSSFGVCSVVVPVVGTLKEVSKKELKKLDLDYGLKISSLSNSYRDEYKSDGVNEGSIVTAINGVKINSIEDANTILTKYSNKIYKVEIVKNNGEKVNYRFR